MAESEVKANSTSNRPHSKRSAAWLYFWVTILTLASITAALQVWVWLRSEEPFDVESYQSHTTALEEFLSNAARTAQQSVIPQLESTLLDSVYAPVYAAIPEYADFHYSIIGEYTELGEAALGQMELGIQERLFDGFEQRMQLAAEHIDSLFVAAYRESLEYQISTEVSASEISLPLQQLTDEAINDALGRARTTVPIAGITAGIVGSGTLKMASAAVATKLGVKFAAKGAVKGGSVLAGSGSGALLCAWAGPGAVICGVAGGIAAWFLTDQVIIKVDEAFNREEFEATLRAIIDEDRLEKQAFFENSLREKAMQLDSSTSEMMQDFRLRDLSNDR